MCVCALEALLRKEGGGDVRHLHLLYIGGFCGDACVCVDAVERKRRAWRFLHQM